MNDLTKFLAKAREVSAKATVAPWDNYLETGLLPMVVTYTENEKGFRALKESVACAGTVDAFANTEFIAFARNHWDKMLDLLERSTSVTYVGGVISVGGHPIADHSELPKENQRLFEQVERQHKQLALHKAPWCDNESDDELDKKLERQGKALEVARKCLDVLRDNRPREQVWLFAEHALTEIDTILAGKGEG